MPFNEGLFISLIIGYILGSFLPAYFIGRLKGFDIRKKGDGNPGIANAAHIMGYKIAIFVAIYDIFKPIIAISVATLFHLPPASKFAAGFAAVLGHVAPFYLRFKGGMGMGACVGIIAYSIVELLSKSWRFIYILLPVIAIIALGFSLRKHLKMKSVNFSYFILLPLICISAVLFYGINAATVSLSIACLWIVVQKNIFLLKEKLKGSTPEERLLLRRKWLRPAAAVFPVGVLFYRKYTLILLATVFAVFVILEILRFTSGARNFPLSYKREESHRISSMVTFLFSALITMAFFPSHIASLAIMFTIFGDLFAWSIGITIGGRGPLGKTWAGTVACFISCFAIVSVYYKLGLVHLYIGIIGAIAATLIELAPIEDDNFSMTVVSAILMEIVKKIV